MVGRTVHQYQFLEKIGSGGMGDIFKAQDTRLNRFVAIKVLSGERASDPDRRRRFLQEAQAASALNHPNIITIHDIVTDGQTALMVMEWVQGRVLADLIPKAGLRVPQVLKYAVQMADALQAAHNAGIVHRDLKPGNVMVTDAGLVKVLDFGLAKLMDRTPTPSPQSDETQTIQQAPLTVEGSIIGTINYMSPEQAQGRPVDVRSDIFTFGVVLYEMATGVRAFTGDSALSTLTAILRDEARPIVEVAPDVPPALEGVIVRCMRKQPDDRYQTMKEVQLALLGLKRESDSGTLYGLRPVVEAAPQPESLAPTRYIPRYVPPDAGGPPANVAPSNVATPNVDAPGGPAAGATPPPAPPPATIPPPNIAGAMQGSAMQGGPVQGSAIQPPAVQMPPNQAPISQGPFPVPVSQGPMSQMPFGAAPVSQAPISQAPYNPAPISQMPLSQAAFNPPMPPPSQIGMPPGPPARKPGLSAAVAISMGGGIAFMLAAGIGSWLYIQHRKAAVETTTPAPIIAQTPEPPPAAAANTPPTTPSSQEMTNDTIIEMVQAKVTVPEILIQIRTSKTNFNLTNAEVIRLTKAGVPPAVIDVMRDPRKIPATVQPPTATKQQKSAPTPQGTPEATQPTPPAPTAATPPTPAPTPAPVVTETKPAPAPPPPAKAATRPVVVTTGWPFTIALSEDIPATAEEGRPLHFTALDDVKVGDAVVIAKGAPVTGAIAEGRRRFGKMTLRLIEVTGVSGNKIRVRATAAARADGIPTRPVDTGGKKPPKDVAAVHGTEYIAYIDGDQTAPGRK